LIHQKTLGDRTGHVVIMDARRIFHFQIFKDVRETFFLLPHYCGLGAGSIPFRVIVNNKQCEMKGLFMSLVIHY